MRRARCVYILLWGPEWSEGCSALFTEAISPFLVFLYDFQFLCSFSSACTHLHLCYSLFPLICVQLASSHWSLERSLHFWYSAFQSSGRTAWDHLKGKLRFLSIEKYFLQIWGKLPVKGFRCTSLNFKPPVDPRPRSGLLCWIRVKILISPCSHGESR